jgi:serine/threonine protein kinase
LFHHTQTKTNTHTQSQHKQQAATLYMAAGRAGGGGYRGGGGGGSHHPSSHTHHHHTTTTSTSSSWGTRTINSFNRTEVIGLGTYGQVSSGFDRMTNSKVAIKKLLLRNDCQLPPTVTREIKILKQMKHSNIVRLIDVVTSKCTRWECTSFLFL